MKNLNLKEYAALQAATLQKLNNPEDPATAFIKNVESLIKKVIK